MSSVYFERSGSVLVQAVAGSAFFVPLGSRRRKDRTASVKVKLAAGWLWAVPALLPRTYVSRSLAQKPAAGWRAFANHE